MEKVSTVDSKAMFFTMGSSYKSRAQRNQILTVERLYTIRNKGVIRRYFGGSSAEGTIISNSDIDKMIEASNLTVIGILEDAENLDGHVFISDTKGCRPGYSKLRPYRLDSNLSTIFENHGTTLDDMMVQDANGEIFLSSERMVSFWIKFLTERNTSAPTPEYRHGPSATAVSEDWHGDFKGVGKNFEQDFAFSIACSDWPSYANEWFERKRVNKWPTKEIIDRIKRMKCHFVPVGDRNSPSYSIEWRVSYLLSERELIWNLNDIQLQCYILMKTLLKHNINPIAPDEISSYHIKTILMWESENSPPHIWQHKYLIHCVHNCLLNLKKCIENLHLEHFIDRRINLLFGKLTEPSTCKRITQKIDDILEDIIPHILENVDGVDLLSVWIDSGENAEEFVQICKDTKDIRLTIAFDEYKTALELYHMSNVQFGVNTELVLSDFKTLALYHEEYQEERTSCDVDRHFSQNVLKFICIRSAFTLLNGMIKSTSSVDTTEKLDKLRIFLQKNIDIDAISGKLYLATYYYCTQCFHDTLTLIQEIFISGPRNLVYVGVCSTNYGIEISNGNARPVGLSSQIDYDDKYLCTVHDVIFSKDDVPCVPHALKFECLMGRCVLVNPLVYMYYLASLSSTDTVNINSMSVAVDTTRGTPYFYSHLNILGNCHYLHGNYKEAYECFTTSMAITRNTKIRNAALVHIIILIFNLLPYYGDRVFDYSSDARKEDVEYLYRR